MLCACANLSSVDCTVLQYCSTLFHKRHEYREKKKGYVKCVFWFYLQFCLKYFSFLKEMSEIWSLMYTGLHVKHQFFLSDVNKTRIFWTNFWNIFKYQILKQSVHWGPSCSTLMEGQTDGQTAMTKIIVAFRNFENAPENWSIQNKTIYHNQKVFFINLLTTKLMHHTAYLVITELKQGS